MKLSEQMRNALAYVPNDWASWPERCYALTSQTWAALEKRGLVERAGGLIRKTEAGKAVFG